MKSILHTLHLVAFAALFPFVHTAASESPPDQSTQQTYQALEAELASLIAQRRAVDRDLENERRAVMDDVRESSADLRDALIDLRMDRMADFMLQEELRRKVHQTIATMVANLKEQNDIVRPERDAPEAEKQEYRELNAQVHYIVMQTVRHYEREAAQALGQ